MASAEANDHWVFYRDRPEWKDIEPIKQDDDDVHVVKIAYSEKFADVFEFVRAVMKVNELSDRAFTITKDALLLNPANYSVWHYRRVLIGALKKSWSDELHFIADMIEENPKNYQVWHHRRCVVLKLAEEKKAHVDHELEFTKQMFEDDAKNYHCWEYRQFLLTHFKVFDHELEFTESLLRADVYNNSAWNQRFFVLTHLHFNPISQKLRAENKSSEELQADFQRLHTAISEEVQFTCARIEQMPGNESAWSYLRGLIQTFCRIASTAAKLGGSCSRMHLTDFGETLLLADTITERSNDVNSSFALEYALDFRAAQLERKRAEKSDAQELEALKTKMRAHLDSLVELDPIRAEWWSYLRKSHEL